MKSRLELNLPPSPSQLRTESNVETFSGRGVFRGEDFFLQLPQKTAPKMKLFVDRWLTLKPGVIFIPVSV